MSKTSFRLKSSNHKGFSLIELIIVITIMAVLIGIVASQVLPYMERSKKAKDQQQLSTITTAMISSIAQSEEKVGNFGPLLLEEGSGTSKINDDTGGSGTKFKTHMRELLDCTSLEQYATNLKKKFRSNAYIGKKIYIEYQDGRATAFVSGNTEEPSDDKMMAESE